MTSDARRTYDKLDSDVGSLISLHPKVAEPGVGRPPGDTGPLLRATVVLIHTAWENYVEQAILEANAWILGEIGDDHSALPHGLRQAVATHAAKKDPWAITGNGWSQIARAHAEGKVARLNTPSRDNVNDLTEECTGVVDILASVSWRNKKHDQVSDDLNQFVHEIRGEIVHKGTTPGPLDLTGVKDWRGFTGRLVGAFDQKLAMGVKKIHGASPW